MVVDVSDLLDQARQLAISSCLKVRRVRCWISTTVLSVRNFFQHHCWWRGDRFRPGPRYVDYVLGILKAYSTRVVQVRSRLNCLMKLASSSASR